MIVDLRRSGTPLPTKNIRIAATVARAGALVLTYDSHIAHITRVGSVILSD
jgi:predicted nucleic acid-binding protein